MKIKYLHTMVRIKNIERSLKFYKDLLGLEETRRVNNDEGKFTLIFLAPPGQKDCPVELTYNWDSNETYDEGRNFGHIAFSVDDFDGSKLRSGESILETKSVLEQHNPDAVLINCSRPEAVTLAVSIISHFGFKFGAYANGFTKITEEFLEDAPTVSSLKRRKDLSPKEYLKFVYEWINLGATIVGGCCEVGPEHIKLIAEDLTKSGYQIG